MTTILINTKEKSSAKFILELIERLGEKAITISPENQEDVLLGAIMDNEKTGETVSRAAIFKKLRK